MAIVLSILDLLLAIVFVFAGSTKAFQPVEKLEPKMAWVKDYTPRAVKLIGWAELLGGVGLILPGLVGLGILQLTAAICLAVLMVGAAVWHFRHNDAKGAIPSIVLAVLLVLLASYMVF
ncbi:putative membrane protein YphA (DoxX/SURF4 family) [Aurantimicrobium minutum]|uniref:DoxX family protein n=1 Tax=Aurantimicrobium minutum TaxID=708131 RepID=UPI002474277B|nr:DoxX family protein [Aurantimicrobium minutum]MDH6277553.1 putative membrane protein YphA (DoxX/SURF4 family) [Aurantimicrobium minutum]